MPVHLNDRVRLPSGAEAIVESILPVERSEGSPQLPAIRQVQVILIESGLPELIAEDQLIVVDSLVEKLLALKDDSELAAILASARSIAQATLEAKKKRKKAEAKPEQEVMEL